MSHIVIHETAESETQYRRFDELERAIDYLEDLQNTADVDNAKLFSLEEVQFEVKQYFKVEVVTAPPEPVVESLQPPEVLPTADVTYVEAGMQTPVATSAVDMEVPEVPVPSMRSIDFDESNESPVPAGGDSRRGLFGR